MSTSPQQNTLLNAAKNPTGKNLQEMSQLPIQNIPIPENTQALGQAAFESQVTPFRRGFQDRLETTIGETARRGIAFGGATGPGAQRVDKLIQTEQELEIDIAGKVGSSLGMTLLDQAFVSSENAKRFQESKELATLGAELEFGVGADGKPLTGLEAKKQFAEFTSGLETEAAKDFANFSADLDIDTQKTLATFMTGLETTAQKDMASFISTLDTEAKKDFANFASKLDISTQKALGDYAQSLKGGIGDDGQALTDVQIAEKMTDISTKAQSNYFNMTNSATRGVNPDTGSAYTDFEMSNIATDLEISRAERQADITKELADYQTILNRGTNDEGKPLTQIEFAEMSARLENKLNNEFALKAMEEAAIAEYGPAGVEIVQNMAAKRGENLQRDMSLLEAVEVDTGLTGRDKSDITNLIMMGAGWDSEPVQNILKNSESDVAKKDFEAKEPKRVSAGNQGEIRARLKRGEVEGEDFIIKD